MISQQEMIMEVINTITPKKKKKSVKSNEDEEDSHGWRKAQYVEENEEEQTVLNYNLNLSSAISFFSSLQLLAIKSFEVNTP